VRDASVPTLWQQLTDFEEMPGPRLTFTSAHVTPEAVAFLAGRPIAERLVFHAACGRLHLWPEVSEVAELVPQLTGRGFTLIDSRGTGAVVREPPRVSRCAERLRETLAPPGVGAGRRGVVPLHQSSRFRVAAAGALLQRT
jgi:hypothetical protein